MNVQRFHKSRRFRRSSSAYPFKTQEKNVSSVELIGIRSEAQERETLESGKARFFFGNLFSRGSGHHAKDEENGKCAVPGGAMRSLARGRGEFEGNVGQ